MSRVGRALALYRRLWNDDAVPLSQERRTIAFGILVSIICCMTVQELAEYYAVVRRERMGAWSVLDGGEA